jgi:multidrug transporter EmrE-like cation transporter
VSIRMLQGVLILVCIVCQVASAIVLKLMPSRYVFGFINNVYFITGVLLVTRAWVWQLVLKDVDLSVAYSFNALIPVWDMG